MNRPAYETDPEDDDVLPPRPPIPRPEPVIRRRREEPVELPENVSALVKKLGREVAKETQSLQRKLHVSESRKDRVRKLTRVHLPMVFDMWRKIAVQLTDDEREFLADEGYLSRKGRPINS